MRIMLGKEFEALYARYAGATAVEDRIIKRRLDSIIACYQESEPEEAAFAHEISEEFSRLILLLLERHEEELEQAQENTVLSYVAGAQTTAYRHPEELMRDFYNYHRKSQSQVDYLQIRDVPQEERKEKVNATMLDYVAKIYTFCNKYLRELVSWEEVGHTEPVLFVYQNIEQILAKFNTKNARGESIKQKVNVRSALRKLNAFKQATQKR